MTYRFTSIIWLGVICSLAIHAACGAEARLGLPPRLQWNANGGYCGEVSLITAGLYYGQYVSQYTARQAAIGRIPQSRGEMLLGVNDRRAATRLHLDSIEWKTAHQKSTEGFLRWVKRMIVRGYPVAIGVFTNEYRFYGHTDPAAGDPQYDHIVPVSRIHSHHTLSSWRFYGSDRLVFSDNGLWGDSQARPYFFGSRFRRFSRNRAQANAPSAPIYSLPSGGQNYGIAITGVKDRDRDTVPVRVATDKNYEQPSMKNGSNSRPAPEELELTVTVSGLQPGVAYRIYRYDTLEAVPDSQFNAHAVAAKQRWEITIPSGTTFTFRQRILSDEVAVYRAVKASAP